MSDKSQKFTRAVPKAIMQYFYKYQGRYNSRPKVFCLGFNKTGTTSLHQYFRQLGMASEHQTVWPYYSNVDKKVGLPYYFRSQCYTDGQLADFKTLHNWFPEAIFVLNVRNERAWLHSRVKHVLRRGVPSSHKDIEHSDYYGKMAKDFFANESLAIESWILERRIYHERVRRYFSGDSRFIELSVTDEVDWQNRLSSHLVSCGAVRSRHSVVPNIHAYERRSEDVADAGVLKEYIEMADRILSDIDKLPHRVNVYTVA